MTPFVVKKEPKTSRGLKLVLGKSVLKKAVERNLLKRRIRTILRPVLRDTDSDFVIIVRPGVEKLNFGEIKEELLSAVRRKI